MKTINNYIEHTILKADATSEDIKKLATDAISGMTSAVNSYYSPTTTLDYAGYANTGYGNTDISKNPISIAIVLFGKKN